VTFYGMSTFEGPLLSIRSVNSLSHYTDWTSATSTAVPSAGTASWPPGCSTTWSPVSTGPSSSQRLADVHFYIGTIGIMLYMGAMWVGGRQQQGLMWRAETAWTAA
jgi:cbb3-type cytochrome oxidase subunit 1